jgi:hypothetical protein
MEEHLLVHVGLVGLALDLPGQASVEISAGRHHLDCTFRPAALDPVVPPWSDDSDVVLIEG